MNYAAPNMSLSSAAGAHRYAEVVVHPPAFRLLGSGSQDGKEWSGVLSIDTPRGPFKLTVGVSLPEALHLLVGQVASYLAERVAQRMLGENSSGGPVREYDASNAITLTQHNVQKAATAVAMQAAMRLPPEQAEALECAVRRLACTRCPASYKEAHRCVVKAFGSPNIPTTSVPLAALSPHGARELAVGTIIDKGLSNRDASPASTVMREQGAAAASAPGMNYSFATTAGAMVRQIASTPQGRHAAATQLLLARANQMGEELVTNPIAMKNLGIMTMLVPTSLQTLAKDTVQLLMSGGVGNPEAIGKLVELGKVAAGGNPQALEAWMMAAQIGAAANEHIAKLRGASLGGFPDLGALSGLLAMARGDTAGDGSGNGYGVRGYLPPQSPSQLLLAS